MRLLLLFLLSFNVFALDNPIVINAADSGKIFDGNSPAYVGKTVSNTSGAGVCIEVIGATDVVIKNFYILDCKSRAIKIAGNSSNIKIYNNDIEKTGGIVVYGGEGFFIEDNRIKKIIGTVWPTTLTSGIQLVLTHSTNIGSVISGNRIYNNIGDNAKTDGINVYNSNFSELRPLIISDNELYGYGTNTSGGGIVVGDYGGSYIKVIRNYLDHAGSVNIRIAGGHHITIDSNLIIHEKATEGGRGIWAYTPTLATAGDCYAIYLYNNTIRARTPQNNVEEIFADPATCFQPNDGSKNINNIIQGATQP
jgi:hypothetical protein